MAHHDNSRFDDEISAAAPHVNITDPQVEGGTAIFGEVCGDVAPLEELHGWNGLKVPDIGACLLVSQTN